MDNSKYTVVITYQQPYRTGSSGSLEASSGNWITSPVYSGGYYVASIPELRMLATGSTHLAALNTVLAAATASSGPDTGMPPLESIRNK